MADLQSFLAHLLIFNLKSWAVAIEGTVSALTFPCGHNNLKKFSCIFFEFILHLAGSQLLDKFNTCSDRKIYSK